MASPRSFAHYTISERIGAGGMGEVFRATDSNLGRDVALKMLPEALAADPERLARLRREAQVLAQLNHPGIAAIYGLESENGQHALAMELVPGPDLAERLRQGPLPADDALRLAVQLAEAVEAAHEKGIVHRDLKPANIKLTEDGRVKVLDFGLAKAIEGDPEGDDRDPAMSPTLTVHRTQAHVILGTAAYMSPEQARGGAVDRRADIWAFGVVLFEMLGGRQLFQGDTVSDTLASVLKSEIDLDTLPRDVPPAVRRLLQRCLRRDPRQRLRDIGDARIVLQEVLAGEAAGPETAVVAPRSPWPLRLAATVAVMAIAAAAVGWLARPDETSLPLRKFDIQLTREDISAAAAFAPRISPDGRHLAYLSQGRIFLRDLASTSTRPVPGAEGARSPFWSPDGEWIGFGTDRALMKVDRSGGQTMILAKVGGNQVMGSASSAVWNPDGTILYTTGSTGILRASAQAGAVTMYHPPQEGEVDFHEICALPDDRGWVFVVHDQHDFGQLALLTPTGERRLVLDLGDDQLYGPAWSPSGHLLFERTGVSRGIWAVPFSLDRLSVTGDPFLVAEGGQNPSVADDGTLVYTADAERGPLQLVLLDRTGGELQVVTELQTGRPFPEFSPDGSQIAVTATTEDGREVWIYDIAGGIERRLTFDGLSWGVASWHPDGRRILAYTEPDYEAYLITLDGSEPRRSLGPGILLRASPDGKTLYYSAPHLDRGFDFDVRERALDPSASEEGREIVATPAIDWCPVPSPDGKILLYVSEVSGQDEVYATTLPDLTGRWQVSRGGGSWPRWRGDGREIYYTTRESIYAVAVDTGDGLVFGKPRKLYDRPTTAWSSAWADGFDVTEDGEGFVMLRNAPSNSEVQPRLVVVQNWYSEFARE